MLNIWKSGNRRQLGHKVALVVFATVVGLFVAEGVARLTFARSRWATVPFRHNHIIRKQADDFPSFEVDDELGHQLVGGKLIDAYRTGFVSLEEIVADPRRKGRTIVLNLGDSSTSGWDSDVVAQNSERQARGESIRSPFHNYRTYADLLADDPRLYVINAGVPGFSSAQGERYLRRLVDRFTAAGVHLDAITVYFGNNDSTWNGNVEDKYLLPGGHWKVHLARLWSQGMKGWLVVPRVRPPEYAEHLAAIARTAREAGSKVVFIAPVVPLRWPPGLRAHGLESEVDGFLTTRKGTQVAGLLAQARELFAHGESAFADGRRDEARDLLVQARENDHLVPRMKPGHMQALREVAWRQGVSLIWVGDSIPLDDTSWFRDYCHPDEPANRLIADAIRKWLCEEAIGRAES
jgi:lysophospholipase L1-like esterase